MLWWDEGVKWLSLHTRKQKANNTSPSSFLVTCSVPFSSNSPFQDTENVLRVAQALNAQVADMAAQRHTRFSKWETAECFWIDTMLPVSTLICWLEKCETSCDSKRNTWSPQLDTKRPHIIPTSKDKAHFPFPKCHKQKYERSIYLECLNWDLDGSHFKQHGFYQPLISMAC